ncbi:YdcF family protein [Candidatus Woesearchaeota archaeon]|nr:YdcF family protein [Candidatus Woesearchaeota archaeon]
MAYDNLIVLTRKIERQNGCYRPDFDGQLRLHAAAALHKTMPETNIVISGGYYNGNHAPSLAEVYAEMLSDQHAVPSERIIQENGSINTIQNFNFTLPMLRGSNNAFLTNYWHIKKAQAVLRNRKVTMDAIAAEDILEKDPEYKEMIDEYRKRTRHSMKAMKQAVTTRIIGIRFGNNLIGEKLLTEMARARVEAQSKLERELRE